MPFEELIWLFTSDKRSRGIVRLNIAEGALLYKYCKMKKDGILLEIGRKFGGSTVLMASALQNGFLHSIDIDLLEEVHEYIKPWSNKVNLITGNSNKIDWDISLDLLFIDGNHSYKGVKGDVKKFTPFVNQGGYVIFHDVVGIKPELQPIIDKLLQDGWTKVDHVDSMLVLQKTRTV